jgi:predicted PurR-regulated permease PerM
MNYKISTYLLSLLLAFSWCLFTVYVIINGSSIDMVKEQRESIRKLENQIITFEIQLTDMHARQRANQERIETINQLRIRDYEFLNSQINSVPITKIKR